MLNSHALAVAVLCACVALATAQKCPSGTEDLMGNGKSCIDCAPGQYDGDGDPGTLCSRCSPGRVSMGGQTFCEPCEAGRFAAARSPFCRDCSVGFYSAEVAGSCGQCANGQYDNDEDPATPCITCHIGSYSPVRSTICIDCVPGKHDHDRSAATVCADCETGRFATYTESTCHACIKGTNDHDQDPSTPCVLCDNGFASLVGQTECYSCPAGTHAHGGFPECVDCLPGSMAPQDEMKDCIICLPGTMAEAKATRCEICPIGTFAAERSASECVECPQYSYGNMSMASGCVDCPALPNGAPSGYAEMKEGGTRLRACCPPGMWANADVGHDTCYACAQASSCIGNGECDTGFEGNWCAACKEGWFLANQKCYECPGNSTPMVIAAIVLFAMVSWGIVSIAAGGKKGKSGNIAKEVMATPMSIIFTRVQISLPVFQLGLSWPQWLLDMKNLFTGFISLDVSVVTAPECFTRGDPAEMYVTRSISKLFVFPIFCLTMTLIFCIKKKYFWTHEVKNTNVLNAWVATYTFLFMMLIKAGFEPFACTTVMGVPLLDAQREIECYEADWILIAILALVTLFTYAVVAPIFLFRSLLLIKVSHFGDNLLRQERNRDLKLRYGWIYDRYRPVAWYWEFIIIINRISSIGITNVLGGADTGLAGWAAYLVLTILNLILQVRVKPYPEIVVDTSLLFNGKRTPKIIRRCMKKMPRYLYWNNMETLGILAQLMNLFVGLYFNLVGEEGKDNILGFSLGLLTMGGLLSFILCNLLAISLRIWALTREGKVFYEEGTRTPLHMFAEKAILTKVFDEMSKGLDIDAVDEENQTPLYIAATKGHLRIVDAMLKAGADPNIGCGYGRWTCLHSAKDIATLKLLLRHGADSTLQDAWGKTAEDTQREEAELPPEVTRGVTQTQADRDRYHMMRLEMAELISDKASARTCDFLWRQFCPNRRTKRITPYGEKLKEKPKRPGMISGVGDKAAVLKHFYRVYGTFQQSKGVDALLAQMLTGDDEIENFDIFEQHCKKLESTYGKNPIIVYRNYQKEQRQKAKLGFDDVSEKVERWKSDRMTKGMLRSQSYHVKGNKGTGEDGSGSDEDSSMLSKSYSSSKYESSNNEEDLKARANAIKNKLRSKSNRYRTLEDGSLVRVRELDAEDASLLPNTANMKIDGLNEEHDKPSSESPPSSPEIRVEESEAEQRARVAKSLDVMKLSELKDMAEELVAARERDGPTNVQSFLDCGDPRSALCSLIVDLSVELKASDDAGLCTDLSVQAEAPPASPSAAIADRVAVDSLRTKSFATRHVSALANMKQNLAKKDRRQHSTEHEMDDAAVAHGLVQSLEERLHRPTILRSQSIRAKSYRYPSEIENETTVEASTPVKVRSSSTSFKVKADVKVSSVSFRVKTSSEDKSFRAKRKKIRSNSNRAVVPSSDNGSYKTSLRAASSRSQTSSFKGIEEEGNK